MTETSGNRSRKIDKNWEEIFEELHILDQIQEEGRFYITSKSINTFKYNKGERVDARNMVKFDYLSSLPDVFKNNHLSILPTRRGEYVIGPYKAYELVDDNEKEFTRGLKEIEFPTWVESIDFMNLSSEAIMLNSAALTGMFQDMFSTEDFGQTLSNRMGSEQFNFNITNQLTNQKDAIEVTGSQIEIDGGYETNNELLLVEAKNSTTKSFLIRQLYYPYRLFSNKISKDIYSIFLQYLDGIFNFSIYKFEDPQDYNSLSLVKRCNYRMADTVLTMEEIIQTVRATEIVPEDPNITFPQANSLSRITGMMNSIYDSEEGGITREEMTLLNDFTYRQAQYYTDAGVYLGLVERDINDKTVFVLTNRALKMMRMSLKDKQLELIRAIFCHKPFKEAFEYRLSTRTKMTQNSLYNNVLEESTDYLPESKESTRRRRASTVVAWVTEVLNMSNDY